mmetsp:Transcript_133307/g.344980  ORF Transcript_133307/g.344980 Transcript_133307/m.344980 type:complete len:1020 (-) Transcript_133307:170-3229(-)
MPLPLLAAFAGNAGALFGYNRANFLYNSGQRVQRQYAGITYQMQLFNLYRQDIRDLVGLTTEKMSNYHVVACLELGMACTLLGPARLPGQVPEWVLWYQLVSLCAAVAFLVASMWLATRAVVVAGSFNVRLQTQYIRLPLPDDEMLDSALTSAEEFESKDFFGLLRLPFFHALWQRWAPSSFTAEEPTQDPQNPSKVPSAAAPGVGGSSGGASSGQASGVGDFANPHTASHLKLYQHLQRKWTCYDAYARVTMSVGTYWLVLSLAYYEIGWVICFQGKILPAVVAAGLFCGILILLVYLDIFVSRTELASVSLLVCLGPAFVAAGAIATLEGEPDATPWFAAAAGVVHICLTVWMWNVGSMVPGKTDLPAKFKGVSYLDIFGPIVRELQSVLDKTGLAGHAHTDHAGGTDGDARAGKAVAPADVRVNVAAIPGPRLDAVRQQLEAAMEAKAGPPARQLRKLHNAVQCAQLAGLDPKDEQFKAAEMALSRLQVPREMRKLRKILAEWREGEVWRYLDDEQRLLVEQMCIDLDAMLGRLHHGAWAAARQPGKASGGGGGERQGSNGSSEMTRGRTAVRSTAGGGVTSCAGRSLSEGLVGCTGGFGSSAPPAVSRSLSDSSDWSAPEDEEIPTDARSMQFETICEQCDELMMRAEALVNSNTAGKARVGLPALQHQPSATSLASSQITEGASSEVGDARKKRRRHGHHPVLAYRLMSSGLVAVWAIGVFMHASRHELVQDVAPWMPGRRLDTMATNPTEEAFTFRWPARFFRPQGAVLCRSTGDAVGDADSAAAGPVELVASNGFLLYSLQVSADPLSPGLRRKLACPVDVHDALIQADCPAGGKDCLAVVAAEGSLWRCSPGAALTAKLGVVAKPLASLSQEFVESHDAMEVWATMDHNLTTVFAGSRKGSIFQFRRTGANLRPVAELQLPPNISHELEWLLLSVRGDELVGIASPGPVAITWSLATGQHLGAQRLHSPVGFSSWCAGGGGELYSMGSANGPDTDRHTWGLKSVPSVGMQV